MMIPEGSSVKPILGVDLGGTNTKIGLVQPDGVLLHTASIPTHANESPEKWIERIQQQVASWGTNNVAGRTAGPAFASIGVGSPGPLDVKTGKILAAPNLPTFTGFAMKAAFEARFGVPCSFENDANCAALAEFRFGPHKGVQNLLVLTLGTGVGSGVISNGRLVTGGDGFATEIGHMIIDLHPQDSDLFHRGSLEAHVGAALAIQRFCASTGENPSTTTIESLFARARVADSVAQKFVREWCRALSIGIGNCLLIFNPEKVVLSGGITASWDLIEPHFREHIPKFVPACMHTRTPILKSELGHFFGVLGAAALVVD